MRVWSGVLVLKPGTWPLRWVRRPAAARAARPKDAEHDQGRGSAASRSLAGRPSCSGRQRSMAGALDEISRRLRNRRAASDGNRDQRHASLPGARAVSHLRLRPAARPSSLQLGPAPEELLARAPIALDGVRKLRARRDDPSRRPCGRSASRHPARPARFGNRPVEHGLRATGSKSAGIRSIRSRGATGAAAPGASRTSSKRSIRGPGSRRSFRLAASSARATIVRGCRSRPSSEPRSPRHSPPAS